MEEEFLNGKNTLSSDEYPTFLTNSTINIVRGGT